ncbi:MFS transporter [Pseudomassariella vexata]|uniref:MFS transporter n=1 Tax=Pseudomassariella vexata TaxID=1141098 RepID=A0A1Y2EH98_9PEZI|nr:MFS transporter [Pseudomassariella vexata]ORY70948.1 MFS transporter [Pseudomassariella vexata]
MDETLPLLQDAHFTSLEEPHQHVNKDIVDFDPEGDEENPVDWPQAYKWGIVALLAFMAFTVTFTCISVVPVANQIVEDLNHGHSSKSSSVLLVTIWELGEAAGPLLIAPLSEVFGRYPVLNAANLLFITATVLAALCQSTPLFIAARALTGLAVASNVLNPAIVGDMFVSDQRGSAMSIVMLAPLIGGAVGPAISGAVAENLGWRQVLWMSAALAMACEVVFLTCFRETYKVPILRRKADRMRRDTGNDMLRTIFDVEGQKSGTMLWEAMMRPFIVLFGSGVLQILSLFGSVAFSYFYVLSTSLPDVLSERYHLSPAQIGSAFLSFSVGSFISVMVSNQLLDRIYIRLRDVNKGVEKPEYRLPLTMLGGFTLPFAVAAYGWAAALHLHLSLLMLSTALLGFSLMFATLPLTAYVVDAFGLYSASALTAVIVTRCLGGTFIPLATGPLAERFGFGLGVSALALLGLCLAPVPVLLLRYGSKWRQRSKYTRDE